MRKESPPVTATAMLAALSCEESVEGDGFDAGAGKTVAEGEPAVVVKGAAGFDVAVVGMGGGFEGGDGDGEICLRWTARAIMLLVAETTSTVIFLADRDWDQLLKVHEVIH